MDGWVGIINYIVQHYCVNISPNGLKHLCIRKKYLLPVNHKSMSMSMGIYVINKCGFGHRKLRVCAVKSSCSIGIGVYTTY